MQLYCSVADAALERLAALRSSLTAENEPVHRALSLGAVVLRFNGLLDSQTQVALTVRHVNSVVKAINMLMGPTGRV